MAPSPRNKTHQLTLTETAADNAHASRSGLTTTHKGLWRRIRFFLQDHPTPLVWAWLVTKTILKRLSPVFLSLGVERSFRWVKPVEMAIKKPIFDCRMCGQCILHATGMTCPMTCPKQLRNGPCGGVHADGTCEVDQAMSCVWVKAVERSARTIYHQEIEMIQAPIDWSREGTASWVTFAMEHETAVTTVAHDVHNPSRPVSR